MADLAFLRRGIAKVCWQNLKNIRAYILIKSSDGHTIIILIEFRCKENPEIQCLKILLDRQTQRQCVDPPFLTAFPLS